MCEWGGGGAGARVADVLLPLSPSLLAALAHRLDEHMTYFEDTAGCSLLPPPLSPSLLTSTFPQQNRLDENMTYFEDTVGACERLLRTPIPLSCERRAVRCGAGAAVVCKVVRCGLAMCCCY